MINNCFSEKVSKWFAKIFIITTVFFFPKCSFAFELGIGTHSTYYTHDIKYYLDIGNEYGFTSFRDEIPWDAVEQENGIYKIPLKRDKTDELFKSSYERNKISSIFILDYGNKLHTGRGYPSTYEQIDKFADYAGWIAERYKGRVKYYEIWNEWLVGTGVPYRLQYTRPDDEKFLYLIKKTSQKIRAVDPEATLITGSINPVKKSNIVWISKLIDGGLMNYVDGISIHPYTYKNLNGNLRTPEGNLSAIDDFERELRLKYNKNFPIYITEMGIPTNVRHGGYDENFVGDFVVKYTLLAKSREYLKGVWWYDLKDDGEDERNKENRFGFFSTSMKEKSAAANLKKYKKALEICKAEILENNNHALLDCAGVKKQIPWGNYFSLDSLDSANQ